MAYTPTVYVNDNPPALNAVNLNKAENELVVLDNAAFNVAGAIPYTGGLTTINADANADKTKLYYVNVPGSANNRRIMKYDSTAATWKYSGLKFTEVDMLTSLFENVYGMIPANSVNDLLDKSKLYYQANPNAGAYHKPIAYDHVNNAWVDTHTQTQNLREVLGDIYGALPVYVSKGDLNANTDADKTKKYYLDYPAAGNHLRKLKFDSEQNAFVYSDRIVPNIWDATIELFSKIFGAIPFFGGLSYLNEDTTADKTKLYFVALSDSSNYLKIMKYDYLQSAWVYTDLMPSLLDVINNQPEVYEANVENSLVKSFLSDTKYDPTDYSYTKVLDYAENDYDHPVGVTVEWDFTGTCDSFNVKISLDGEFKWTHTFSISSDIRSFYVLNLDPSKVACVKISAVSGGTETVLESRAISVSGQVRMLSVEGIRNVRDIGGWKCQNGRIKYNKIFRGSAIDETGSTITANGKIVLYDLMGIRAEIDLRNTASPSQSDIGADCTKYQIKGYSYLTGFNDTTAAYAVLSRVFTEVAAGNNIYMHCSGGCDRTAFYVCMIEGLLGVNEDDINKDFELSSFMDKAYSNNYRRYRNMGETYDNRNWAGLIALIKNETGSTWGEKFYNYFLRIGFTAQEIADFREAMIEV